LASRPKMGRRSNRVMYPNSVWALFSLQTAALLDAVFWCFSQYSVIRWNMPYAFEPHER
jgi:hypothetical protein